MNSTSTRSPEAEQPSCLARRLAEASTGRPLLLDGGLGTELLAACARAGVEPAPLELLNASHPALVVEQHTRFLQAGAQVITTNTFCGQRGMLEAHDLGQRVVELNTRAAELAVRAARAAASAQRPRWTLGSMGPGLYGSEPDPVAGLDEQRVRADYREQARALLAGGVDGLLIETATRLRVAQLAVDSALEVVEEFALEHGSERPAVLLSFHVDAAGRVAGSEPRRALAALAGRALALVGLNCASGPDSLAGPLDEFARALAPAVPSAPALGVWPNAGTPAEGVMHPVTPASFAAWFAARLSAPGLALVGGCCGAGPAHIAALAALIDARARGA